jgi:hypothetical protein
MIVKASRAPDSAARLTPARAPFTAAIKIIRSVIAMLKLPDVQNASGAGRGSRAGHAAEFAACIRIETAKPRKVIELAGLEPERAPHTTR